LNDPAADLARIRFDNAMRLFDEFVQQAARHPDAATLRGLEGRFAERLGIQPSYWSQIKAGSRQIGERLARQFEVRCRKPYGWMDRPAGADAAKAAVPAPVPAHAHEDDRLPHNEDERFIVGLVLTYYRRHPERARARLLELLGEVLAPPPSPTPPAATPGTKDDADAELWRKAASAVAPLKRKR
jgi:hypothetical protein